MLSYKIVVDAAAATEPVTLVEAKTQLRVQHSLDDAHISSLISVARDRTEQYCNRYFTAQDISIIYSEGLSGKLALPFPDVTTVNSITYLDSDNAEQTVLVADYFFDQPESAIYFSTLPPAGQKQYTVKITTKAPLSFDGVKMAILMMVADLYELRTETVVGQSVAMNPAVKSMLYPYRVSLGI